MTLVQNLNWEQLPPVSIGDKVKLQYLDGFNYEIEAIVTSKNNDSFLGDVLDVINVQGVIVEELKSKPISFDKTHVFLIKK